MTGVMLLGLLLLKHGLLAHVVDFGYTASRRGSSRFWYVALFFQCLAEMAGTLYVLSHLHLQDVVIVLLVEFAGLCTGAVVERESPLEQLLMRHITCEGAMVLVYAGLAIFLAYQK